ncbi:MAG: tRNA threonylcarbamoyladenosine dehydratase [Deltaproteobacteria bacterium]|nr:tRNA threonylcarbamoyladenosine dehydratase [Deltaproteobacteria bacterium]
MPDKKLPLEWHEIFSRLIALYGLAAVKNFAQARVIVFGVGGVGSFAAEALVRSAIGNILLVDFDTIVNSNINRQLQAFVSKVGQPKATIMRERLYKINPYARIDASIKKYDSKQADILLKPPWPGAAFDYVVDCIDDLGAKAHLLATCRTLQLPVVSSMGAGGKTDPTRIRIKDLAATDICPLAQQLRKRLRQKHGFPRKGKMGVMAVFSEETPQKIDTSESERLFVNSEAIANLPRIHGTLVAVTGSFGLACASQVINSLRSHLQKS